MTSDRTRVVVWSTGGVGSNAIRAIARRRDLELVGVWVHTPGKVGRDAGELAGIAALGVEATNDVDALIGLAPDCVVYAASGPERGAGGACARSASAGAGAGTAASGSDGCGTCGRVRGGGRALTECGASGAQLAKCGQAKPLCRCVFASGQ